MYENLQIVPEGIYCSDPQYIKIRQITGWMRLNTSIRGNWFRHGLYDTLCEFDVCLANRVPYGDTYQIQYTVIPYEEIPQQVLDYLHNNNYIYQA